MNKDNIDETLKSEVGKNMANVSMNFKYFQFRTFGLAEGDGITRFPFPKYRSFQADKASVFYKHISRIINH